MKYHFQWVNEDDEDVKKHRCFDCLVQSNLLHPDTKTEVSFDKTLRFIRGIEI